MKRLLLSLILARARPGRRDCENCRECTSDKLGMRGKGIEALVRRAGGEARARVEGVQAQCEGGGQAGGAGLAVDLVGFLHVLE